MYSYLIPIGIVSCFILLIKSSSKAKYYFTPVNEEEEKDFKKPFRFRFWITVFIVSIIFSCAFVPLGFLQSNLMKGA